MTPDENRTDTHEDRSPLVPPVQRWQCCHCGGTGLNSYGDDTCPHCHGSGNC